MDYSHSEIEKKWQEHWRDIKLANCDVSLEKNNFYNKHVSTKIIKKNLFPKIIHSDKKNSLYVYEYFDGKQVNTLNKELIIKTAKNLKKELLEIAPSANEDYFLVPRVVE